MEEKLSRVTSLRCADPAACEILSFFWVFLGFFGFFFGFFLFFFIFLWFFDNKLVHQSLNKFLTSFKGLVWLGAQWLNQLNLG